MIKLIPVFINKHVKYHPKTHERVLHQCPINPVSSSLKQRFKEIKFKRMLEQYIIQAQHTSYLLVTK